MTQPDAPHHYFRLLAAAAIDGEVTPSELGELRAHLASCAACRADERAMRSDNAWLASTDAVLAPRPSVRDAVLSAAGERTRQTRQRLGGAMAAAATVAVAVGALWWVGGRTPLSPGAASPGASMSSSRPSQLEPSATERACSGDPFAPASVIGTSSAGLSPWAIAAADLNEDGLIDLVILNKEPGSLGIMLGDGRGAFSQPSPVAVPDPNPLAGSGEPTLQAVDVTNDGHVDAITANPELGRVTVFAGDGTGVFGGPTIIEVGGEPGHAAVGDFGGDASLDLAVADESGAVQVLIGSGTGAFAILSPVALGGSPRGIDAADLDGDGRTDLVVGHDGDHRVDVLRGTGDGTFGAPLQLEALAATDVNLVDIDGDGDLDALLSNSGPDSVSVLLGDGAGSFGAALVLPVPNGAPGSTQALDLDGDGHLDVVANAGVSGDLAVFIGDGGGGFQLLGRLPADGGPTGLASGDFDRDGRPDVATSNANASSVSVFLNRCDLAQG